MKKRSFEIRSITDIILFVLLGCFIVQVISELFSIKPFVKELLSLNHAGLEMGFVWQFLTYGILHDGPLHLIFNMLGIHFIGRSLELIVGSTRYLSLLLISLIVGGLMWVVFNPQSASLIGFSASVLGVMSLYTA